MSRIWAIMQAGGGFVIRHCAEHPAQAGHADECVDAAVYELPREPDAAFGETVDPAGGALIFVWSEAAPRITAAIKTEAEARILAVAPLWRQINDGHEPDTPGAAERRRAIRAIRDWSNQIEAEAMQVGSAVALRALLNTHQIAG